MKRSDTQCIAVDAKPPRKKANRFNRVFGRSGVRVRGLWERNGLYYAQIRVSGRKVRLRLEHAVTVPQAIEEMQARNKQKRAGTLQAPRRKSAPMADGAQPGEKGAQDAGKGAQNRSPDAPLKEAIAGYQNDRNLFEEKDKDTPTRCHGRRERTNNESGGRSSRRASVQVSGPCHYSSVFKFER